MKSSLLLSIPLSMFIYSNATAHGNVTPQAMDTSNLPALGEEWLEENPWRDPTGENWQKAVSIGSSGYNENCARCHGLEVVSGGIAPDLRLLSADSDGDEWYIERFRHGATQNGITKKCLALKASSVRRPPGPFVPMLKHARRMMPLKIIRTNCSRPETSSKFWMGLSSQAVTRQTTSSWLQSYKRSWLISAQSLKQPPAHPWRSQRSRVLHLH